MIVDSLNLNQPVSLVKGKTCATPTPWYDPSSLWLSNEIHFSRLSLFVLHSCHCRLGFKVWLPTGEIASWPHCNRNNHCQPHLPSFRKWIFTCFAIWLQFLTSWFNPKSILSSNDSRSISSSSAQCVNRVANDGIKTECGSRKGIICVCSRCDVNEIGQDKAWG